MKLFPVPWLGLCLILVIAGVTGAGAEGEGDEIHVYRLVIQTGEAEPLRAEVTVEYGEKSIQRSTLLGDTLELPVADPVASFQITVEVQGRERFVTSIELPENADPSSPLYIDASRFWQTPLPTQVPSSGFLELPSEEATVWRERSRELSQRLPIRNEFSAQEPPKVAILIFNDTDSKAGKRMLGKTVSTMMVSFLKDNSQFSVVDRQNTTILLEEWRRIQEGQISSNQGTLENTFQSVEALALEGLDRFILGDVSIVGNLDGKDLVEIDARLLRLDGSIHTVAHGSGEEGCLRDLVHKVGRALEQKAMESEYGELEIRVDNPEKVWIHLTPVPLESDERATPAELGLSLDIGNLQKSPVQSLWITDPKRIVIDDVLTGYYSLRLDRAGYRRLGTKSSHWRLRQENGTLVPYYGEERISGPAGAGRFLVKVDRDRRTVVDRQFVLEEAVGSLVPILALDYPAVDMAVPEVELTPLDLDRDYWPPQPGLGCLDTKSSRAERGHETESLPTPQRSFEGFATGNESVRSDSEQRYSSVLFHGLTNSALEELATGKYRLRIRLRDYEPWDKDLLLDGDSRVEIDLKRKRGRFALQTTQPVHEKRLFIEGQTTGYTTSKILSPRPGNIIFESVPIDTYRAFTDIEGFSAWDTFFDTLPFPVETDQVIREQPSDEKPFGENQEPDPCRRTVVKSQMWIAGDLVEPSSTAFFDACFHQLVDKILVDPTRQTETGVEIGMADAVVSPSTRQARQIQHDSGDLLQQLDDRLLDQDLIVLDDESISKIRSHRGLSASLHAFLVRGGVLVTFLSQPGQYKKIFGKELTVETTDKHSKWQIRPGSVNNFKVELERKKQDWQRSELDLGDSETEWKRLAVQKRPNRPLILERAVGQGYVIVIATSSGSVQRQIPEIWPRILRRAFLLAQYAMFRRYDGESGSMTIEAKERLEKTIIRL